MEIKKIKLPFRLKNAVLSLGSQTKNVVCFAQEDTAYLSSPHQDLSILKDYLEFENKVKYFLKKNPKIIAYDLHPEYQASKFARYALSSRYLVGIQHHHAHIASCMAENGLKDQKVIGVAFDGTGLGSDKRIWGAEFLLCDYKNFTRQAHLREIPLLGGEKAVWEPWRLAAAWLSLVYKEKFLELKINFIRGIDKNKWKILKRMYQADINSPSASSMGRLFDAVASLIFARYKARFEAELAMKLEKLAESYLAQGNLNPGYKFKIIKTQERYILDPLPLFREMIQDLESEEPKEKIAYKFHLSIAKMITRVSWLLRKESGIKNVILTGGVFQNNLLLRLALDLLSRHDFKVFIHQQLPPNDSSISLGQAIIANRKIKVCV